MLAWYGKFKKYIDITLSFVSGFVIATITWFSFQQSVEQQPPNLGSIQAPLVMGGTLLPNNTLEAFSFERATKTNLPGNSVKQRGVHVRQIPKKIMNPSEDVTVETPGSTEVDNMPLLGKIYEMAPPGIVENSPIAGTTEGLENQIESSIASEQSPSYVQEKSAPSDIDRTIETDGKSLLSRVSNIITDDSVENN